MAELSFDCIRARAEAFAVAPTLTFTVRISETSGQLIDAVALRCQMRIEPGRRSYSRNEAARLVDLFGDRARWPDTLRPLQLATVSAMVPGFAGAGDVDLPVPLTYDMEIGASRYFAGLEDGEVPLLLLFSGTVFAREQGRLSVTQVPWSKEVSWRLPVRTWRAAIDAHFPGCAWVRLSAHAFDQLAQFKSDRGLPTFQSALLALLAQAAADTDTGTVSDTAAVTGERR